MKTVTTKSSFTKKNNYGSEMKVDITIEVQGECNPNEIAANVKAIEDALYAQEQMPQQERQAANTSQQLEPMSIQAKGSNNEKKATDKQLKMVETILWKNNKSQEEILQKYQITSLAELTHSQVMELKQMLDPT